MEKVTLLLLAAAFSAFGAPVSCPATATLQDFINFGSAGCTVGSVILSDFQFSPQTATNNPTATDIQVSTIGGVGGGLPDSLFFQDSDGIFSIGASESIHFFIDFNIAARTPDVYLYQVGLSGTAAETGNGNNAKVREIITTVPGGQQLGQMQVTQGNSGSFQTRSFATQPVIHVNKEWDLFTQNNTSATASVGVVSQDFFATPEPGSMALLGAGAGLLLVASIRRRRVGTQSTSANG